MCFDQQMHVYQKIHDSHKDYIGSTKCGQIGKIHLAQIHQVLKLDEKTLFTSKEGQN